MKHILTEGQGREEYIAKRRNVYWVFMDLEKTYDRDDSDSICKMLRLYGVGVSWREWFRVSMSGADRVPECRVR